MVIIGKDIAAKIYQELQGRVGELQKKGIVPHLAVILVGNDPRSEAYVSQKQHRGNIINAQVSVEHYEENVTFDQLKERIEKLNTDTTVHGILIQRPLPKHIDEKQLELLVNPQKDIDGFHPESPYTLPLPLAVMRILEEIYAVKMAGETKNGMQEWLHSQKIVILGKGLVGGQPIINYMRKRNLNPEIIDSKTDQPENITRQADIIISAVGKETVITAEMVKKDVILIGVGLFKGSDGKLHGDYDEEALQENVGFYTPTLGGVGPVNIAMLMDNLVTAAEKQTE